MFAGLWRVTEAIGILLLGPLGGSRGSMQVDIRYATAKAFGLAWDANPAGGSR
jgi:hypothetical protein